ncbi:AAA family ATPase [bacterium]|nr:AAA family ATPase [bacterium]
MLELIKTMILDFQESDLEIGVPRRQRVQSVARKATILVGVRRSGKSTLLAQRIHELIETGVSRQNILYLNFFDDRLHGMNAESLRLIAEAYFALFPEKKGAEQVHCFFDEIQMVEGWEPFVDRMMRTEKCEVYLTGSSARMLSKEIATQMRGRALSWEVFPFSFREFLDSRGLDVVGELSTKGRLRVQKAFAEFWETGGFPEVAAQPSPKGGFGDALPENLRVKTHQEYFHATLFRDLIERHDIPHPRAVSDLAHRLLSNAASLYTINSLTGYLKSLGHSVPKSAVSDYLLWFEDAYFLFSVRMFDASIARSLVNPKKIYSIDHALARSVSPGILLNTGHLLENLVFVALRRQDSSIHYYKTKSGKEVDFIVSPRGGSRRLVQVCESLADPETRRREVVALEEAMREQKLSSGVIVTRSEDETINVDAGEIRVLPAWRYLLEIDPAG